MVDLKNLKKKKSVKNRFGKPPSVDEAGENLEAPEAAPVVKKTKPTKKARAKTARTAQFATRVTPEFLKAFKAQAFKEELKIVELLEASFEAYKKKKIKS